MLAADGRAGGRPPHPPSRQRDQVPGGSRASGKGSAGSHDAPSTSHSFQARLCLGDFPAWPTPSSAVTAGAAVAAGAGAGAGAGGAGAGTGGAETGGAAAGGAADIVGAAGSSVAIASSDLDQCD